MQCSWPRAERFGFTVILYYLHHVLTLQDEQRASECNGIVQKAYNSPLIVDGEARNNQEELSSWTCTSSGRENPSNSASPSV